jgi:hypothetical protein
VRIYDNMTEFENIGEGRGAREGEKGGGEAAMSQSGGVQRLSFRGKEPKKTSARSARARMRGQNRLV